MKLLQRLSLPLLAAGGLLAQSPGLTLPPSGNNQRANVTQFIGPVKVTIEYSSPAVHGPDGKDRRGQIWGKLVPYGMTNLGFGNGKPGPWRAGANENTVLAVSNDVLIEDKPLPAGRYGLHMIPGQEEWTLIFSKNSGAWGSFFYDDADDALRITVKPHKHEYREWLTYEFPTRKPEEATAELQWEELAVPWNIKVDKISDIYISHLRHELNSVPGFSYQGYMAATQYCVQSGTHLDLALQWADAAISMPFIGQTNFGTLDNKAQVLAKLGRDAEADALMDKAVRLPGTTSLEIHQYGRRLLAAKKNGEALKVFQLNAERNGDAWPVHVGLARAYAATGDNGKALEHAKKAAEQAPDPINKKSLEAMVKALSDGQPIAQ
jgi:tetratricopeptide (TPR) repeat protein